MNRVRHVLLSRISGSHCAFSVWLHHQSTYSSTRPYASQTSSTFPLGRKAKQRLVRPPSILEKGDGVCAAYCVNTSVSLIAVSNHFKPSSFSVGLKREDIRYKSTGLTLYSDDVVHVLLYPENSSGSHYGHAFFFSSGAAVFWGLPTSIRRQLLKELSKFQERSTLGTIPSTRAECTLPLVMEEFDHEFNYTVDNNRKSASFRNDAIRLSDFSDPIQLLALSYGLAQSVHLLLFEEVIDNLVKRTRTLPDELARDGRIQLSQRDLKRLIGELLAARYSVNLVSDIMDTPEFFWKNAELEGLHVECAREVELRQRSRILDARTQVIKDALDVLNNELSSSSSGRVERAILFLIGVEVVIEIARLVPSAVEVFG